jgi:hypothetical protein
MTPFLHNWADLVEVETSYVTVVTDAEDSLAEERCGLLSKPTRSVRCRWTGISRAEGHKIVLALTQAGAGGLQLPLYCDQALTTSSSSGTTINCPTADRRFAVGAQVVIFELDGAGRATNAQVRTLSAVGASSLTVSSGLTGTYDAGALVFPVVTTHPVLAPEVEFSTDDCMTVDLTVLEKVESALPPLETVGDDPTGFDLEGGVPIFDVEPDWAAGVTVGLETTATSYPLGRSQVVETRGPRPRVTVSMGLTELERADVFKVLRFFDSRGGRLAPFFLPCPAALWTAAAVSTGYVDVDEAGTASEAEDLYTHAAVVLADGTVYVREITGFTDQGATWRITVSPVLPAIDLADVVRITPAFLVRFADDSLRESWLSDAACRIPLRFLEVLSEGAVTIP